MSLKRENGRVYFDLTEEEFARLMLLLGIKVGERGPDNLREGLALANAINEGNPTWAKYGLPKNSTPDDQT
jgi:hypothetical protein